MKTRIGLATALAILLAPIVIFAQTARLRGHVVDPSGLSMPGVQITVYAAGKLVREGTTSLTGDFDFALDPGEYKVELSAAAFRPYTQVLNLTPNLRPLAVTMALAPLTQSVDVSDTTNQVSIEADSSLKTTVLGNEFVDTLPDEVDNLAAYLQQIAGSRGSAGEDATFVIDGFTDGRVPPKEQITEIRINNNPFSAEFSGPGFGRTEIVTKAGTADFHGTTNFLFRDASLNARNAFASTKPPYQQRNLNSSFSGPIVRNKVTLNFDLRNNENENSDTVRAILPSGLLSNAVVMPNINRSVNSRGQWALTSNNTLNFNIDYQRAGNKNQGIGGFTLPERAWTRHARNAQYQIRDTAILNTHLVHEIRVGARRDYSRTIPATFGVSINVLDAFNSGSAQNESVNDNHTIEFWDLLMYTGARLNFKAGVQALRRKNHNVNYNNFFGTYTFSSLTDYIAGRPVTFSRNSGTPVLDDAQVEAGTFVQSDWKVARKFNLSLGARYETQTNINDHNNLDPRAGFAYQISNTMAVRGGIGVFHQRLDQVTVDQLLRLDGVHQRQIVISFPSFPDPFVNGTMDSMTPISVRVRSPGLVNPYSINSDLTLERSLPKGIGLTFSWDGIRTVHLYRSRNINAPFAGFLLRPNPSAGNFYQLESTGTARSNNLTVGFKEVLRNRWNLNVFGNYTLGWNNNDTDGPYSLPADNYSMRSEWGRAPSDQRHRFVTGINVRTFWNVNLNTNVQANSNRPYNITTGFDDNHDTNTNDRPPGVKRNSGAGPRYFNANLSLLKTIRLKHESKPARSGQSSGPALTFILNFWNALNTTQYVNYSGVMTSTFFARPNRANNPRNVEVGMRLNF